MNTALPETMHCVEISQPGEPAVLLPATRSLPEPGPDDVLIAVAAAGVNRPDIMQRKGLYPPPPGASDLPGLEVAGSIVAMGERVSQWQLDDEVCALCNGGGYAQYVAVPARQCLPVPEGMSMSEAASLPEALFTVWSNVFERGQLQAGESFLVHGGSSGIGITAIQLARAFGARVFASAGSDEKCRACEALGAELAINYREQDFVEVLKAQTDGEGVDVILDMVGGSYINRNLKLAAVDGRIINIAFQEGFESTVNFVPLLSKRLTLSASTLRPRNAEYKAALAQTLIEKVIPLYNDGFVRALLADTFSLADAASAHQLMESSRHIGKIVLKT
ncbi:MAG: NAD(P)H-quinone oxidoreductase [Parahaliea sp.]